MFTLTLSAILICTGAALLGGFIDAIAGGGGLITMPALLLTGVPPHLALGTNKVSSCVGTSVALGNFARSHLVLWRLALAGLVFSLLGAYAGSILALYVNSEILGKILVGLLPVGMCATLLPKKERECAPRPLEGARFRTLVPLVCLLIGAYDGFFGPGTGSFLILAFHWILRVGLIEASATSKVLNLASNFGAVVAFIWHGKVLWPPGPGHDRGFRDRQLAGQPHGHPGGRQGRAALPDCLAVPAVAYPDLAILSGSGPLSLGPQLALPFRRMLP